MTGVDESAGTVGYEFLRIGRPAAGVLSVTLDRPPVNAVNQTLYDDLRRCFDSVMSDETVAVVILSGAGAVFCAGNDLEEFESMTPENGAARMREVMRMYRSQYECAAPVIAAVDGAALGTGMGLVCCCDVVVASERAVFGLPEINVGVFGGVSFLTRMVPEQAARRMFLTGDPVSATELRGYGAPIELVASADLPDHTLALARRIAAKGVRAVRTARTAFNVCEQIGMWDGYALEQGYTVTASGDPAAKEALRVVREQMRRRRVQT